MELENKQPALTEKFKQLLELEPKLITYYVPSDAGDVKQLFLADEIDQPIHNYDRLDAIDFEKKKADISAQGQSILSADDMNPKFVSAYHEFVENYQQKTRFAELAYAYNYASDENEKQHVADEYMHLNIELNGEPDKDTYHSLLQEKLASIRAKDLHGTAAIIAAELEELVGDVPDVAIERFHPSLETMNWMHDVVEGLYGDMLAHVPDKDSFTAAEVKTVFEDIIQGEFGEAAEQWHVDLEPAKAINVKTTEQRIVIPEDRPELQREVLRKLVVHELGVHVLRSIMGAGSDLDPLAYGLNDYYDSEEGLGVIMEQALTGTFREPGVDHYITAGLAYHDKKNFRDTFEVKWRLAALNAVKLGEELTQVQIDKARNTAYAGTMRMFRGTDELPWFKDLAYYNGAMNTWRHLEAIRGDDIKFTFLLLGKADPSSSKHEQLLYETASR